MSKPEPISSASSLEVLLARALAIEPSERALALIDARVGRAMALARPSPSRRFGGLVLSARSLRLVVALALAAVVLMGAAVALTLMQQAAALMPGWQVAYERALPVRLSETVGAYTVTLERAYADPNQLVLVFVTAGPHGALPAVPRAEVTDAQGRHYLDFAGGDIPAARESVAATIDAYDVPPGVRGPLILHVRVDSLSVITEEHVSDPQGPWLFDLTVQLGDALTVAPARSITAADVPITLDSVRFSSTAIRVHLSADLVAVRTPVWSRWSVDATIRHGDGAAMGLDWAAFPSAWVGQPKGEIGPILETQDGSEMVRQATSGVDDPSGPWTLDIERLRSSDGQGHIKDVPGTWTFRFTVP